MTQAALFPENAVKRKLTIDERFQIWIKDNPNIVGLYLQYAREAKNSGRERYGIGAITERVRWHVNIQTTGDEFKINNDFRAPLARLLVKHDPSLSGLFSFRERKKP